MAFQATGLSGEVRYGYQTVARLGHWAMDDGGRVEADAQDVQTFWLDQGVPMALWLTMGRRAWVWKAIDIVDRGRPFVVRVHGSPEVKDAPRRG